MNQKPTRIIDERSMEFQEGNREVVRRYDPEHELFSVVKENEETSLESLEDFVANAERTAESYEMLAGDCDDLFYAQKYFGGRKAVYGEGFIVALPYDGVWFEAMISLPELVERLMDAQTRIALKRLDGYAAQDLDVKLMFGGGDLASQTGPFYSPLMFRRFLKPRYKRLCDRAHELGFYLLFASDGNTWPLTDDLFCEGMFDGYYEIDRLAGMDMESLAARFPHLVRLGGIASKTLHLGSRDEIKAEADSALSAAAKYGRAIVGVSNQVVTHTPPDNLVFLMDYLNANR